MAKILIADDDAQMRDLLHTFLESKGHQVVVAEDGLCAVEQAQLAMPDLPVIDLIMPKQEGIETIIRLRRDCPGLEVIAMSGHSDLSRPGLRAARLLGARNILVKPFSLLSLESAVRRVCPSAPSETPVPSGESTA